MAGRHTELTLEVPIVPSTNGAEKDVRSLRDKTVQIAVPGGANWTMLVQGTVDGTNWETLGTYASAGGLLAVPESLSAMRVRCTAYVAAAPTITVAGFNARDEGA